MTQDCPRPELGCYLFANPPLCALSGGVGVDQPCNSYFACAPGFDCIASAAAPDNYVCRPYCDADDDTAPNACSTLCPGNTLTFPDGDGNVIGTLCLPS